MEEEEEKVHLRLVAGNVEGRGTKIKKISVEKQYSYICVCWIKSMLHGKIILKDYRNE